MKSYIIYTRNLGKSYFVIHIVTRDWQSIELFICIGVKGAILQTYFSLSQNRPIQILEQIKKLKKDEM